MSKFSALALTVEKPFRVFLKRPDNNAQLRDAEGNPAYVDVYSTDSRVANDLSRAAADRRLSGEKATSSSLEAEGIERLANMSVGWYLVGFDGTPLGIEFSVAEARALYSDPACEWVRNQVGAGAADRGNFTPALPSA